MTINVTNVNIQRIKNQLLQGISDPKISNINYIKLLNILSQLKVFSASPSILETSPSNGTTYTCDFSLPKSAKVILISVTGNVYSGDSIDARIDGNDLNLGEGIHEGEWSAQNSIGVKFYFDSSARTIFAIATHTFKWSSIRNPQFVIRKAVKNSKITDITITFAGKTIINMHKVMLDPEEIEKIILKSLKEKHAKLIMKHIYER